MSDKKVMTPEEWLKEKCGGRMNSPFVMAANYAAYYHAAKSDTSNISRVEVIDHSLKENNGNYR